MSRITQRFASLREKGEKALIIYLTAGDPNLEVTRELILALDEAGVDCLEVGCPFSDPTADGPTIQAASQRALRNGTTLAGILEMIASVREVSEVPICLFGYYNPILSYGPGRFAARARKAGVDGILVVDLPPEEAEELRCHTDPLGLDFISLIAPTTGLERAKRIAEHATGFLYYISVTGVTGTKRPQIEEVARELAGLRELTDLPIVVGFGISTPEQAREIAPYADGIVVGSAIVKMIGELTGKGDLIDQVAQYARQMKMSLAESK